MYDTFVSKRAALKRIHVVSDNTVIPATEAPAAQAVGSIGVGMMVGIIVASVIMDIPNMIETVKMWKELYQSFKQ